MKKFMFVFGFLLIIILSLYCIVFEVYEREEILEEDRIYISTALATTVEFKERYDIRLFGYGLKAEKNTGKNLIDKIRLGFAYHTPLNKHEARKLLVALVESYVNKINMNRDFDKYLYNPPFTVNEFKLHLISKESVGPFFPLIKSIRLHDGTVTYEAIENDEDLFSDYETETFEEAQRIVHESTNINDSAK